MTHDESLDDFDFDVEDLDDGYDPFAETVEAGPSESQERPVPNEAVNQQAKPASERIDELMDEMKPHRRVLLGVLSFLSQPRPARDLAGEVDRLQQYDFSVFNAANYSEQLEWAGAIARCDAQGNLIDADYKQEPEIVTVDGRDYYKPLDAPEAYWVDTEDGKRALEADRPFERLLDTIGSDKPEYLGIYTSVLGYCDTQGGRQTADIQNMLKADPKIGKMDHIYASRFADRLEQCDALRWEGAWKTTDVGRRGLEQYAGAGTENGEA